MYSILAKSPWGQARLKDQEERTEENLNVVKVMVVGFLVAAGFIVSSIGSDGSTSQYPDSHQDIDKVTAVVMSQIFIRPQLKSPATADFCGVFESNWSKNGNDYVVDSCLDSQNGFGANIRTNYVVDMTYSGGTVTSNNSWDLNKLVVDGEVVYP